MVFVATADAEGRPAWKRYEVFRDALPERDRPEDDATDEEA